MRGKIMNRVSSWDREEDPERICLALIYEIVASTKEQNTKYLTSSEENKDAESIYKEIYGNC